MNATSVRAFARLTFAQFGVGVVQWLPKPDLATSLAVSPLAPAKPRARPVCINLATSLLTGGVRSGGRLRQEKPGEGGRDVGSGLETFRWNPVGNQSHPVEPSQQPEASLASWWGDPPGEA